MNLKQAAKNFPVRLALFIVLYLAVASVFYWIVADAWTMTAEKTEAVSMGYLLPADSVVSQAFTSQMDGIEELSFVPHFDQQERVGSITLSLHAGDQLLWSQNVEAGSLASDTANQVPLQQHVTGVKDQTLTLTIEPNQTGMALWAGNTMSAGKFDVEVDVSGMMVNQTPTEGCLVMTVAGHRLLQGRAWFWPGAVLIMLACVLMYALYEMQTRKNQTTVLTKLATICQQYKYLVKQLVWRDFRVKYKSSVLGVLWSFLNPLLTMLVYYLVFSTLFKSNVEHFSVYLMSGIVLYNYFSEATSLGLGAIVDNSALITKVYMPKIIYPFSKVLSSAINLCISFIPLFLVMLIDGVPFTKSLLLLPVLLLFLIMFITGMSLLLSTLNVFFRDTRFLWGVLLTMWNFLTPIFYPESIIPAQYLTLYHMNPMYQLVFFMRSIVLNGVSPTPLTYLYCLLASGVPLALGLWVFRKHQDQFVLHL